MITSWDLTAGHDLEAHLTAVSAIFFRNAGVLSDERGIASFGSFRKNFITRCDKIGMRRTATRGIVGQVSDEITDIYSTDYAGALVIKKFQIPTESCM
ncbi:MAG: hypothetical protein L6W00_27215 [Lentisphaeria bacterium]|nr:MAG: hypothetical protein L6W00_27215 [Lentisphaeria bacterium]